MKDDLEEFSAFILEELDNDDLDIRNETKIYLVGKIMSKLMELRPPAHLYIDKRKLLSGIILKETDKAMLLLLDKDKQEWFPRSQMSSIKTGRTDQEIFFVIPEWLYNDKYDYHTRYDDIDDSDYEMDEILGTYFDQC